ncbi:phytoene desaturase family protein [Paenibacillus shenyangensis]|uniref:phytoene desaturase family protein n=1 Tax=Paenibacillus sp. A9 TaxID=1284352 RepID=UPI000371E371|nr:phytoene desaturase family protein [Paenibacillus sp. A9]
MKAVQSTRKAVIVGAGPGGLAAGMLLASHGYEVDVYEKQAVVGGRSSRLHLGEYQFDRGATFLMMPHLIEELFEMSGRSLDNYVDMQELTPLYSLHFGDMVFKPSRDREDTAAQIARLFPGDEQGYYRYLEEEDVKLDKVMPLLRRPFAGLADYMRADVIRALPKLHLNDTVYGRLSRYFKDERLKQAFTFQSKYLGMSAWECPGTFTILSYLEHRYGLFHPKGGLNSVFEAMAKVISEHGGRVHTSRGVQRVITQGRKATGVVLDNEEQVNADHVVINADFATAMNQLFEPGVLRKYAPEQLAQKKYSCSAAMLYLGIDGAVDLEHHSVHFSADYHKNVDEITKFKTLSEDPSIYVHNPSVLDDTLAPAGKSALYILMPTPNLTGETDWEAKREQVKEQMLNRAEQIPQLQGLRDRIEEMSFFTPLDWEQQLDVYQGATFNLTHNLGQMMAFRPHNQFEEVDGVWLVGGGTHPGSGLPTIFESARISTSLIFKQDGVTRSTKMDAGSVLAGAEHS